MTAKYPIDKRALDVIREAIEQADSTYFAINGESVPLTEIEDQAVVAKFFIGLLRRYRSQLGASGDE